MKLQQPIKDPIERACKDMSEGSFSLSEALKRKGANSR